MDNLDQYLEENLDNFTGDQDMDLYTGEGDDLLNFSGAQSFANEIDGARIFVANIVSTFNTNKKIAVLKGYEDGVNENTLVGGITGTDSSGKKVSIIANGSPTPFINFHEFVKNVPVNLVGMRISSDKPEQLQQVVQFVEKSPFTSPESKDFFLGSYINENTYRDNIVTVPTPGIILGPETKMLFNVIAGAQVSITFFIGAALSTSSALRKKRDKAIRHINMLGVKNVRRLHAVRPGLFGLPRKR